MSPIAALIALAAIVAVGAVGFLIGRAYGSMRRIERGDPAPAPTPARRMPAGLLAAAVAAGYGTHVGQVEVAGMNAVKEGEAAGADCWNCELDRVRQAVVCAPKPECSVVAGEGASEAPCDAGSCAEPTWVCERSDAGTETCRVE